MSIWFASMHGTHNSFATSAEPSGLRATLATPSTFMVPMSTRATRFVSCET
jgi:hypothetical protein